MAIKLIEDLKAYLRRPNPTIVGGELSTKGQSINQPMFIGQPVVSGLADPDFRKKPATVADIKGVIEHNHVKRNMTAIKRMSLSNWSFKVNPVESFDTKKNPAVVRDVTNKLWEFNKIWNIGEKINETFDEVLGYRYCPYEVCMGQIGQWTVPTYFEHLQAYSFARASSKFPSDIDSNYVRDGLLRGIVYEGTDRHIRFFQSQSGMNQEPIEIPAENVFYVTDGTTKVPDGGSYLSGIVGTILSHNKARMATNQVIDRGGVPNAQIKVHKPPVDELGYDEPSEAVAGEGTDMGGSYSPWWIYGVNLAKMQGKDNRTVIPDDIDIIWPDLKLALNPMEADHYFIQEIIDQLVPIDVLKQMGTSLSKSSKELLLYIQLIMGGYRDMMATPFTDLMTYILNINGYEGWWVESVWVSLAAPDVQADRTYSLDTFKAGGLTVARLYKETNRDPLEEGELEILFDEIAKRNNKPAAGPGGQPSLSAMSSTEVDSIKILMDGKKGGVMRALDKAGYFKKGEQAKVAEEKEKGEA
jgi:hypothetical protein